MNSRTFGGSSDGCVPVCSQITRPNVCHQTVNSLKLSPTQARRLTLTCQGLHKRNAYGSGEAAVLNCVENLGYVQVDTISVINRAHHHTLWTRVPTFHENELDTLQRERKVFEYWAHAAAYLPMRDFRFSLPYMNAIAGGQKHWRSPDKKTMASVIRHIRAEGPAMARDFEDSGNTKPHFWGGKKPAKLALEQLFIEGELMISRRAGFQKVFDLTERVLPNGLDTSTPTNEEFLRYLIDRTIRSQGIATEAEIRYLRKGLKADLACQIQQMLSDGEIIPVQIDGKPNTYYSYSDIIETGITTRIAKNTHLLSPFDNLVIQRKRVLDLFEFDYQIECYVPEAKRKHGYFCLPILFGDAIVGRLDPKADRARSTLLIRNLVIENKVTQTDAFASKLARTIKSLAAFNDCENIDIERCNDKRLAKALSRLVA
ncbi:winged helix-turn-helix domain-containing protein [Rhodopirellula sp. SWK7]|uniref:winged helix-turn-helix domain-containing protein n=1 Tax=Rhodopirellula sp. SWK7 TaxID=595460 RepID=UPI00191C42F6|nr:crosslink repair DNA glycosylase YcaQ family protein [Rhodopirellula sp. SWK7]